MVGPAAKRTAVAYARDVHGLSQRRACQILEADRSSVRYRSRQPDDPTLRGRIRELACECRRFGYRRLQILLEREGHRMNHKKFRRLYREEKLQVKRRGGRKRALGTRRPLDLPSGPNQRWSLDFVSDAFTDGRRFRILAVVDDFSRECLALVPDTSLSGRRVARELDAIIARRGKPRPQQNAFAESFIGRLRDECLNETLFTSLAEVRAVLAEWCDDYNQIRPHSSLGNQTPIAFARQWGGSLEHYGGSTHRPIAQPAHMGQNQSGLYF